jgi:hypothetical protein
MPNTKGLMRDGEFLLRKRHSHTDSEDMKAFQWLMHNAEGIITVKYHDRYAKVITRPGWQELLHR